MLDVMDYLNFYLEISPLGGPWAPFNSAGHGTLGRCQCLGTCATATESVANRRPWKTSIKASGFCRSLIDVKQGETGRNCSCWDSKLVLIVHPSQGIENRKNCIGDWRVQFENIWPFKDTSWIWTSDSKVKQSIIRICERQIQPLLRS